MSDKLSLEYLNEIRKRCSTATEGPWIASIEGRDHPLGGDSVIKRGSDGNAEDLYLYGATAADYDFIAHAKQDIPLLIGEVEQLQKIIEQYCAQGR